MTSANNMPKRSPIPCHWERLILISVICFLNCESGEKPSKRSLISSKRIPNSRINSQALGFERWLSPIIGSRSLTHSLLYSFRNSIASSGSCETLRRYLGLEGLWFLSYGSGSSLNRSGLMPGLLRCYIWLYTLWEVCL